MFEIATPTPAAVPPISSFFWYKCSYRWNQIRNRQAARAAFVIEVILHVYLNVSFAKRKYKSTTSRRGSQFPLIDYSITNKHIHTHTRANTCKHIYVLLTATGETQVIAF